MELQWESFVSSEIIASTLPFSVSYIFLIWPCELRGETQIWRIVAAMGRRRRKVYGNLKRIWYWNNTSKPTAREIGRPFLSDQVYLSAVTIYTSAGGRRIMFRVSGLMRGGKSCRLRWKNYLRPNIKRGTMSKEEEDLIIRMHKLIGNRYVFKFNGGDKGRYGTAH